MEIKLRCYQDKLYKDILSKLYEHNTKNLCVYLPTGGGKSILIAKLANDGLTGRTLILTHRTEIFNQNIKWLKNSGYLNSSEANIKYDDEIIVAMVETLYSRIKSYGINYLGKFNNIIVDEAHVLIYEKVFKLFNYNHLIGFTGSPVVYGKSMEFEKNGNIYTMDYTLNEIFDDIALGPDENDLIKLGYLVNDNNIVLELPDFDKLKESKSNPDGYTSKSMNEVYFNAVSLSKLYEGYLKYGVGRKSIIFNSSNKVNKMVYDFFVSKGVNIKMFDTSKNVEINPDTGSRYKRKEIVDWFNNEREAVLTNTNVFTTGFDVSDIESVFVNRATKSLALWIQMVGRGSRITNKVYKPFFYVVDLGQNIHEHGLWSDKKNWKELFFNRNIKLKKDLDFLRVWECSICGYYNPNGINICQDCGNEKINQINPNKNKIYKTGEFKNYDKPLIPSGNKIVEYCKNNNLDINDAFKILSNQIVELFVINKVTPEFYKKHKDFYVNKKGEKLRGFDSRVMEIFRPCYFSILDRNNGLLGNRSRKITTQYNRILKKIRNKMDYNNYEQ